MKGLTDETLNLAGGRFVLAIRNRQTLDSERKGSDDMRAKVETTRDGKWLVVRISDYQVSRSLNLTGISKDDIQKIISALETEIWAIVLSEGAENDI